MNPIFKAATSKPEFAAPQKEENWGGDEVRLTISQSNSIYHIDEPFTNRNCRLTDTCSYFESDFIIFANIIHKEFINFCDFTD